MLQLWRRRRRGSDDRQAASDSLSPDANVNDLASARHHLQHDLRLTAKVPLFVSSGDLMLRESEVIRVRGGGERERERESVMLQTCSQPDLERGR